MKTSRNESGKKPNVIQKRKEGSGTGRKPGAASKSRKQTQAKTQQKKNSEKKPKKQAGTQKTPDERLMTFLGRKGIESGKRKMIMGQIDKRIRLLLTGAIFIFALLAGRAVYLAVSNHESYSRIALSQLNSGSSVTIARPGDILDANGSVIATSYCVYILILDPKVILATEKLYPGSLEKTVELAAEVFELDEEELLKEIEENPTSSYLRFNRKTVVSEEQKDTFEEQQELVNNPPKETEAASQADDANAQTEEEPDVKVKGIWFEEEYRRYYPYGAYASKLIGFTTQDATQGLWGLEKSYNDILRGTNGRKVSYINSESDADQSISEAVDGNTLQTTIDMNLTMMISDELSQWFAETDEDGNLVNDAKAVQILLMDPNTGGILAYVTDTDYDLNNIYDLTAMYSDEEIAAIEENTENYELAAAEAEAAGEELEWDFDAYPVRQTALNEMWRCSLVSDSYEPGSTGKVMTFAAALEEKVITPDTEYTCTGVTEVAKTLIKCHNYQEGGCGEINSMTAIAASCNVAFVEIGQRLGREKFSKYQQIFNLGQKTGIDLPGETSCEGLLYSVEGLNDVELATNAFGQCYNVTMIQLAAAVASTINGGYYYRPFLGKEITDSKGNLVESMEPLLVRQTVSEDTSELVREALRETITNSTIGTGGGINFSHGSMNDGYTFIAKTGTAQKLPRSENKYLISVISAVPMDDPQVMLYVAIDEYQGELQADSAPAQELTGNIWGRILDYMGIYADRDPGPEINYETESSSKTDEAWDAGDNAMENLDGDVSDTPVPPEDDGSGSYEGIIVSPDSVLNPEDVLPQAEG